MSLTLSVASANIVYVDLAGTVGVPGFANPTTVTSNAVQGVLGGVPPLLPGTTTLIAPGTPFTARFTYNTSLMPPVSMVDSGGVNGGQPFPTHDEAGAAQWATFSLSFDVYTFNTLPDPRDVAPIPVPPQSVTINIPLIFENRVAYGDADYYDWEAFHGSSAMFTSYFFSGPPDPELGHGFHRIGDFDFVLNRSIHVNEPFLPPGPGIPEAFDWVDHEHQPFPGELGLINFYYFQAQDRLYLVNGEPNVEGSFVTSTGLLRVTSAHAYVPVPEPATIALTAFTLALILLYRRTM